MAKLEADVASAGKLLDREARRSSRQTVRRRRGGDRRPRVTSGRACGQSGAEPIEADTEVGNEDAKLREIRGRIDRDKSQEASDAREMEKAELVASVRERGRAGRELWCRRLMGHAETQGKDTGRAIAAASGHGR
eukprot:324365-Hanusia_phi.AAC.1